MRSHRLFAAVYDAMNRQLEEAIMGRQRARLVADLRGDVLELGAGTGATLSHYRDARRVIAAEPDAAMRRRLLAKAAVAPVPVHVMGCAGEALPYPDGTFDAVVCTCVLCSVHEPDQTLAEAWRVLKPNGRLAVLEHVRGGGRLAVWQDRLTPIWSALVAGCHPNRDIQASIERAGFSIDQLDVLDPFPKWVPARPMLAAVAIRRAIGARSSSGRC